jgi:hypothetical protein
MLREITTRLGGSIATDYHSMGFRARIAMPIDGDLVQVPTEKATRT